MRDVVYHWQRFYLLFQFNYGNQKELTGWLSYGTHHHLIVDSRNGDTYGMVKGTLKAGLKPKNWRSNHNAKQQVVMEQPSLVFTEINHCNAVLHNLQHDNGHSKWSKYTSLIDSHFGGRKEFITTHFVTTLDLLKPRANWQQCKPWNYGFQISSLLQWLWNNSPSTLFTREACW